MRRLFSCSIPGSADCRSAVAPRASILYTGATVIPPIIAPFGTMPPDEPGTNNSGPRSPTMYGVFLDTGPPIALPCNDETAAFEKLASHPLPPVNIPKNATNNCCATIWASICRIISTKPLSIPLSPSWNGSNKKAAKDCCICRAASSANTVSCVSFSFAPGIISRFPVTSTPGKISSICSIMRAVATSWLIRPERNNRSIACSNSTNPASVFSVDVIVI